MIYEASKQINIVYDRIESNTDAFNKAYVILDQTYYTIFLGFSYLPMSLNRFGLRSINNDRSGKPPIVYIGTCFERTRWENEKTSQLFKSYECDIRFGQIDEKSVQFLRNNKEFNIDIANS